jgi:hypothetical protein
MTETQLIFYPPTRGRGPAIEAGFRFGHIGTHTSRTIMLDELGATFEAVPREAKPAEYTAAIIEANCLGKKTVATRRLSFQRLREVYALDSSVPMFRILRQLWETDVPGRPLLALLSSLARDPLLMATAETVIGLPDGAEYQRAAMRGAVEKAVGERMNESTIDKVVRNAASSWSQSGHLVGRTFKFRRTVQPTLAAVAFALYLAHAAGFSGEYILSTGWLKAIDCGAASALELATAAKRVGLIDLKMAGDVFELNLDRLDPLFLESRGRA